MTAEEIFNVPGSEQELDKQVLNHPSRGLTWGLKNSLATGIQPWRLDHFSLGEILTSAKR
jgi:hypothetical protein